MSISLKNFSVLITRPEHQAQSLCQKIQNLGGKFILFPTIVIADIEDQYLIKSAIQKLSDFDMAIFISPNAVEKTIPFIRAAWPIATKVAAVGASTANALRKLKLPNIIRPQKIFNSESLLSLPELQVVAKKRIVIFKGENGRELLSVTLRERGAVVTEVCVYRRIMPSQSVKLPDDIDVIVCTSNVGLQNLYSMVDEKYRQDLLHEQLLVISDRMIVLAQNLGFVKTPWVADNATDEAIIAALIDMQEEKHGRKK